MIDMDQFLFEMQLDRIRKNLIFYSSAIMGPLGIIGCLLTAFVYLKSKTLNKLKGSYLFAWLAILNMFALISEYLMLGFLPSFGSQFTWAYQSTLSCILTQYLCRITPQAASLLQVLIVLDRYIDLKYPRRFMIRLDKRFTITIIISLFIFLIPLNSYSAFYELDYDLFYRSYAPLLANISLSSNETNQSSDNQMIVAYLRTTLNYCGSKKGVELTNDIINALLRAVLPYILIAVLNFKTLAVVLESKKRVFQATTFSSADSSFKKEREFARLVTRYGLAFVICNLPFSISLILMNISENTMDRSTDLLRLTKLRLVNSFCSTFAYSYYSLTFLINLKFNRIFRSVVKSYLSIKLKLRFALSQSIASSSAK